MSACRLIVNCLLLLSITYYLLPITTVHAQSQGETCTYREERDDGMHVCEGTYKSLSDTDGTLTCQFTEGVTVAPCPLEESGPEPTPAPTTSQSPQAPSPQNWDAFKQVDFTGGGVVNWLSCAGAMIPFGTDGCNGVTVDASGVQHHLVFYNGEGGGALGTGTHFIAQMYNNPPASGINYMANAVRNFGLAKPVFAQVGGTGAGVIEPVQKIWQVSRNIAYLAFVVVFVAAGFMIMLRAKLNPQTVVSVQAALPGLVVGLILVTFSYFISGLIIDTAFLASNVAGILFLSQIGGDTNAVAHVRGILDSQNVVQMFSNFIFTGNLLGAAQNIGSGLFDTIVQNPANRVIVSILGALGSCIAFAPQIGAAFTVSAPIGGAAGWAALALCAGGGGAAAGFAGGIVVSAIVYIVLLFGLLQAVFRLLFSLIGAYVSVVISTIFAPFIILWSSIPGNGGVLGLWWRSLLGNVLVFPAVFIVFLLVATILGRDDWHLNSGITGQFNQTLPLFGNSPVGFIQAILAYGLLLAAPGVPDFVREMLHSRPNQIMQQAIGRGFATGTGVAQVGVIGVAPAIRTVIRRFTGH